MNFNATSPAKPSGSNKPFNWTHALLVVVLLAIAAYRLFSGPGEKKDVQGVGAIDVPATVDLSVDKEQANSNPYKVKQLDFGKDSSSKPYLADGKNESKVSPEGLVYTASRSGEHRTEHVLRHAADQPNRAGSHGVFKVGSDDDVFRLIDEAYRLIKSNSKQVTKEKMEDGKTPYVVDMKRVIGFKGGQSGKRAGNPELRKIKLILAENRVITAYPY